MTPSGATAFPKCTQQAFLICGRHQVKHVEEQHGAAADRRVVPRIAFDNRRLAAERPAGQRRDSRPQLDPDQRVEHRDPVGRRRGRGRTAPGRLDQQREHQALAAADIHQRSARRQHTAGEDHAVERIAAHLPARELPRGDAAREISIGGAADQIGEGGILIAIAGRRPGQESEQAAEGTAKGDAADHQVGAEAPRTHLTDRVDRQRMNRSAPQPGADLDLAEQQHRRHERIRDVGGEIHLQPVEAERTSEHPAERQVQPVDRKASHQNAQTDREPVPAGPLAFGAELVDETFHGAGRHRAGRDVLERRSHAGGDCATHARPEVIK